MATDYRATTLRPYFDLAAETFRLYPSRFSRVGFTGLFFSFGLFTLGASNRTATREGWPVANRVGGVITRFSSRECEEQSSARALSKIFRCCRWIDGLRNRARDMFYRG